jgi:hypothetical protein
MIPKLELTTFMKMCVRGALAILWLVLMTGLYMYAYVQYEASNTIWLGITIFYLVMSILGTILFAAFVCGWLDRGRVKRANSGLTEDDYVSLV